MTRLSKEASIVFWFISDIEYSLGVINLADMQERDEVFQWLLDPDPGKNGSDPRGRESPGDNGNNREEHPPTGESTLQDLSVMGDSKGEDENQPIRFLPSGLRNRWCFTKDDRDFYPSVPHGHLNDKNNPWPKLTPYTGRAYSAKDVENTRLRLSRDEMIDLWNNKHFRAHALETIAWYSDAFPRYNFPVDDPRRLPRWRRR